MAERPPKERPPLWKRLRALMAGALLGLSDDWQMWLRGLQRRLRQTDLAEVLAAPNTLAAQSLLSQIVQHTLEVPARLEVPRVAARLIDDAGQATVEHISPTRFPPPYITGLPDTEQWIAQQVGAEIRGITATTMQTVRQTLQNGRRNELPPHVLARQLRGMTGLTPRQANAIEKQAAKWAAEGMRAGPLQKAVRQLQERALRHRAEMIARTETAAYSNYAAHQAMVQQVRRGLIDESSLVRNWTYTTDAKCCDGCAKIPEMNPDGVGLHVEFQTPFGPKLLPPAHPNCRCEVTTTVRGTH